MSQAAEHPLYEYATGLILQDPIFLPDLSLPDLSLPDLKIAIRTVLSDADDDTIISQIATILTRQAFLAVFRPSDVKALLYLREEHGWKGHAMLFDSNGNNSNVFCDTFRDLRSNQFSVFCVSNGSVNKGNQQPNQPANETVVPDPEQPVNETVVPDQELKPANETGLVQDAVNNASSVPCVISFAPRASTRGTNFLSSINNDNHFADLFRDLGGLSGNSTMNDAAAAASAPPNGNKGNSTMNAVAPPNGNNMNFNEANPFGGPNPFDINPFDLDNEANLIDWWNPLCRNPCNPTMNAGAFHNRNNMNFNRANLFYRPNPPFDLSMNAGAFQNGWGNPFNGNDFTAWTPYPNGLRYPSGWFNNATGFYPN